MADSETALIGEADVFSPINFRDSDDCLLASSSEANAVDNFARGAQEYELCASVEPEERKRNGKFNPRKSLAWDSAFFTSAGILDPDELSDIIERADSGGKQKHLLPGIQEELSKSTDSISTFESDNLTLESLEADLFCDIRASIQRSTKASSLGNSNSKRPGNVETRSGRASKMIELPSANTPKPKFASRKQNPGTQALGKTMRLGSLGAQVNKAEVQSRESMSSLHRPPLATGKAGSQIASPIKRMSISASHVKTDNSAVGVKGRVSSITKVPNASAMPRTITSARTLGSSAIKKTVKPSTRTSCDSSSSCSSQTSRASSLTVIKRKVDRTAKLPSSGSYLKTPSKVSLKAKPQSGSSQLLTYLPSTPKLSSSISPASSISEWSTESSVSTATVNQKPIDMTNSTSSGPCSDSDSAQTMQVHHGDEASTSNKNSLARQVNQSAKQTSAGNDSLPHPFSAKPSGLRLPSPKIGFFDGAKTGGRTPSGNVQSRSGLSSFLAKSGAQTSSPSLSSNKVKVGTITPKTAARIAATSSSKLGMQKKHSATKVAHHPQKSSSFTEKFSSINAAKNCVKTDGGVDSRSSLNSVIEVAQEVKQVSDPGSSKMKEPSHGAKSSLSSLQVSGFTGGTTDLGDVKIDSQKFTESNLVNSCCSNIVTTFCEADEKDINCSPKNMDKRPNQPDKMGDTKGYHGVNENEDIDSSATTNQQRVYSEELLNKFYLHEEGTNQETSVQEESDGGLRCRIDTSSVDTHNSSYLGSILASAELNLCSTSPEHTTPGTRIPLTVKNSVIQMEEVYSSLKGSTMETAGKTTMLPLPQNVQKENS